MHPEQTKTPPGPIAHIKPYIPGLILSREYSVQSIHKTLGSRNVLCIGPDRNKIAKSIINPNILQADCSYVILDIGGEKLKNYGSFLAQEGYHVEVINHSLQENTCTYNPCKYIKHKNDIDRLVNTALLSCKAHLKAEYDALGEVLAKSVESCITHAAEHLLRSCVQYLLEECNEADWTLGNVRMLLDSAHENPNGSDDEPATILDYLFAAVKDRSSDSVIDSEYQNYRLCCNNTRKKALELLLAVFDGLREEDFKQVEFADEVVITDIRKKKTAIFLVCEEKATAFSKFYHSLFISHVLDTLIISAERERINGKVQAVKLMLDDAGYIAGIIDFSEKLSLLKQKKSNVSVFLSLDSIRTLEKIYPETYSAVLTHMDIHLYFPSLDTYSSRYVLSLIYPHYDSVFSRFVKNVKDGIVYHTQKDAFSYRDILFFYRHNFIDKVSAYDIKTHSNFEKAAHSAAEMTVPSFCREENKTISSIRHLEGGEDA